MRKNYFLKAGFLLVCFLLQLSITAQNPSLQYLWSNGIGSGKGYAIANDANDNVIIGGSFTGTLDFDPGPLTYTLANSSFGGNPEYFLAKYDMAGGLLWAMNDPVGSDNDIFSVDVDQAGNIYACGTDAQDIMFMKVDGAGNLIWKKNLPGTAGNERGWKIKIDALGNIYMCGHFAFTTDFDATGLTFNVTSLGNGHDAFVAKFDNNGNPIWVNNFATNNSSGDRNSMCLDKNGNVIITGILENGTADFDQSGPGGNITALNGQQQVYCAKYNNNGNHLWSFKLASPKSLSARGNDVKTDTAGNVFITGYAHDSTDFDPGNGTVILQPGSQGMFVAKYGPGGNYLWAHAVDNCMGRALALNSKQEVVMTGEFGNLNTGDFDPGSGMAQLNGQIWTNAFIAGYTNAGAFKHVYAIEGGVYEEVGYDIDFDNNQDVLWTGYYSADSDFDFSVDTAKNANLGNGSIFYAKYKACDLLVAAAISHVTCNGDADGAVDLTVTGQTGFYTYNWSNAASSQDISSLNGGMYSYTVTESNGCKERGTSTVNESAVLSATYTPTDESICGTNDGSIIQSAVTGGTPVYTYTWSGGGSGQDLTGLAAGMYTVTITDVNNCTYTQSFSLTCTGTTGIAKNASDILSVFPNPSTRGNLVTVRTAYAMQELPELFTFEGKKVNAAWKMNGTNEATFDPAFLSKGIYLIRVNSNGTHHLKLSIE